MTSPHLEAERNRLLDHIAQIRASGDVAPAYCWLTQTTSTKNDRTYTYALLVTQKPGKKPKSTSLGRLGREQHRYWQDAINRREAIIELEKQLVLLQKLIERQVKT
jgi:hypothetical protein